MPEQERMLNQFLLGAVVMAASAAGLFFLRFYRRTHDRLFVLFAIAFWILALNWAALAFIEKNEVRTALYILRTFAFGLILFAIIQKNGRRA